jgi:hypothetical protein
MENSDTTCKPQLRVLKNHLVLKIMRKWQKKRLKIPILDNTNNKTKAHCTPINVNEIEYYNLGMEGIYVIFIFKTVV